MFSGSSDNESFEKVQKGNELQRVDDIYYEQSKMRIAEVLQCLTGGKNREDMSSCFNRSDSFLSPYRSMLSDL